MLKYNEIEAKFDAGQVGVQQFATVTHELFGSGVREYKTVGGYDRYYTQGENVVRHRFDGIRRRSILTVKKRLSSEDLTNRQEVDLPLSNDVTPEDATRFLTLSGWQLDFEIEKMSYIFKFNDQLGDYQHGVCVALYDVWRLAMRTLTKHESDPSAPKYLLPAGSVVVEKKDWRRFLEIEIDKSCVEAAPAIEHLNAISALYRGRLSLGTQLNQSLFEIYRSKKWALDPI